MKILKKSAEQKWKNNRISFSSIDAQDISSSSIEKRGRQIPTSLFNGLPPTDDRKKLSQSNSNLIRLCQIILTLDIGLSAEKVFILLKEAIEAGSGESSSEGNLLRPENCLKLEAVLNVLRGILKANTKEPTQALKIMQAAEKLEKFLEGVVCYTENDNRPDNGTSAAGLPINVSNSSNESNAVEQAYGNSSNPGIIGEITPPSDVGVRLIESKMLSTTSASNMNDGQDTSGDNQMTNQLNGNSSIGIEMQLQGTGSNAAEVRESKWQKFTRSVARLSGLTPTTNSETGPVHLLHAAIRTTKELLDPRRVIGSPEQVGLFQLLLTKYEVDVKIIIIIRLVLCVAEWIVEGILSMNNLTPPTYTRISDD